MEGEKWFSKSELSLIIEGFDHLDTRLLSRKDQRIWLTKNIARLKDS